MVQGLGFTVCNFW